MKQIILLLTLIVSLLLMNGTSVMAQTATEEEALTVATNWVSAIIAKKGSWGGSENAEIEEIVDFSREGRQVGYFCNVSPTGYIIVSLRKEMAPVKAYSATEELDPLSEDGPADLLKGSMERLLNRIEEIESEQTQTLSTPFAGEAAAVSPSPYEIDYRPAWDILERHRDGSMVIPEAQVVPGVNVPAVLPDGAGETAGGEASNYVEGEVLLSVNWQQGAPYNNSCPTGASVGETCSRTLVGCVATAGAQLMRYWNWPPYGVGNSMNNTPNETVSHSDSYDWVNMPDSATTSSSAAVQAAVAELNHEVGVAVGMDYGCGESSAFTGDMEGVFEDHFRYSSTVSGTGAQEVLRSDYTATSWFTMLKAEFNYNRPVQYRITGHSIVGDGWQIVGTTNQYHMNYGWSGSGHDIWYTVDSMTTNPGTQEYVVRRIIPSTYLTTLSGTYPKESFRYRYFYRDTTGGSGTFAGGNFLQFLPGVVVKCTSGTVRFENSTGNQSRWFTRGNLSRGVYMPYNSVGAAIKMYQNGGVKFL